MRLLLILLLIPLVGHAHGIDRRDALNLLGQLDRELSRSEMYLEKRVERIDSIRRLLAASGRGGDEQISVSLGFVRQLGDLYNPYMIDSALHYYAMGAEMARRYGLDSVSALYAMKQASFMPLQLRVEEAVRIADSLRNISLPQGLLSEMYDSERQMSNYISNFYANHPAKARLYDERESRARRALLTTLPQESDRYRFNYAEELCYSGRKDQAQGILLGLIDNMSPFDPLYARAAHLLSEIARDSNNLAEVVYYLALSARSDILTGTLEVCSLQDLGQVLYDYGYIDRAHGYLSQALSNAVDCQAPLRVLQTSEALPIIQQAHQNKVGEQQHRLYIALAVLLMVVMMLFVLLYILYKKKSTQAILSSRLEEANHTKDVYISKFLSLCSTYMEKMQQFTKIVERKISTGKEDDLLHLAKSGKLVEEQSMEFYEIFDDAFLSIYPTFVEDVNRLLQPDRQVSLKDDEKLNTDLRILALMRLGIDDTSRIAQMLNYSVYTIYTYRNKFKNRAINRDTFDTDILSIASIH